jgi:hypothetical protein
MSAELRRTHVTGVVDERLFIDSTRNPTYHGMPGIQRSPSAHGRRTGQILSLVTVALAVFARELKHAVDTSAGVG